MTAIRLREAFIVTLICLCIALTGGGAKAQTETPQTPEAPDEAPVSTTLWIPADALGSGWGMYPITNEYGGTKPLSPYAMHGSGKLTWVADIPQAGEYHFWIRRYGGYGQVEVTFDETPITGGKKGPGGGRYVWQHLGKAALEARPYHLDIHVKGTMFDALLITQDAALDPHAEDFNPGEPASVTTVRAPRAYRDDSSLQDQAGRAGVVVGSVAPYSEHLNDWQPTKEELLSKIQLWGSPGQYIAGDFAVRALREVGEVTVSLPSLQGPKGRKIDADHIDLRVVSLGVRPINLYRGHKPDALLPDLLVRNDRQPGNLARQGGYGGGEALTRFPTHESRQFRLVVGVPASSPAGLYKGQMTFKDARGRAFLTLPVEVDVMPIDLQPVEGYYSSYNRAQPINEKDKSYVSLERYEAELVDMVRHGLNTTMLYGGFDTLPLVAKAGMTEAPCLMHWPTSNARAAEQIAQAKALGLRGLHYYGVDEPRTPEAIERSRKEALRRQQVGQTIMMAINQRKAQQELADVITHPIFNLMVFSGKDNAAVADARKHGHHPISYWVTDVSYPLYYRAFAGLYNIACGYEGIAPWAYFDQNVETSYYVVKHDDRGHPVPTLRWHAMRDGIDDVRYLQALDRALAAGQKRLEEKGGPGSSPALSQAISHGQEVRQKHYEALGQTWHRYLNSLKGDELNVGRRAMAEAIVRIDQALR